MRILKQLQTLIISISCILAAQGCGDEPRAGAASCHAYVDRYCTRALTCQTTDTRDNCEADLVAAFPDNSCDSAVGVTDATAFDGCLTSLATQDCTDVALGKIPQSCAKQIQF